LKFPLFKGRDLYITGESYAGHYIPALASYIVKNPDADFNLKGVAIVNGWVDPYDQYPQYAEFANENKLISKLTYYALEAGFGLCKLLIKSGVWPVAFYECQLGTLPILGLPFAPAFNVYDIRKKCDVPPLCYDFSLMDKFIAREDVRAEIGVGDRSWESCNMVVHTFMLGDWVTNMQSNVADLLKAGVKVLVYSGDKDFICNWRGGEAWTNSLEWEGKESFQKTEYEKWSVGENAYGEFKNVDNLTFLRVFDAGHMVPMDQPEAASKMLDEFMGFTSQI